MKDSSRHKNDSADFLYGAAWCIIGCLSILAVLAGIAVWFK